MSDEGQPKGRGEGEYLDGCDLPTVVPAEEDGEEEGEVVLHIEEEEKPEEFGTRHTWTLDFTTYKMTYEIADGQLRVTKPDPIPPEVLQRLTSDRVATAQRALDMQVVRQISWHPNGMVEECFCKDQDNILCSAMVGALHDVCAYVPKNRMMATLFLFMVTDLIKMQRFGANTIEIYTLDLYNVMKMTLIYKVYPERKTAEFVYYLKATDADHDLIRTNPALINEFRFPVPVNALAEICMNIPTDWNPNGKAEAEATEEEEDGEDPDVELVDK